MKEWTKRILNYTVQYIPFSKNSQQRALINNLRKKLFWATPVKVYLVESLNMLSGVTQ